MPDENATVIAETAAPESVVEAPVEASVDAPVEAAPEVDTPEVDTPVDSPVEAPVVSFMDSLPEGLRGHERLNGIESVEDLAQKFSEVELAPTVPGAAEYSIPEGLPPQLGEIANKLKLTQEQLGGTAEVYTEFSRLQNEAQFEANQAATTALIDSWGEKKPETVRLATRAIDHVAGQMEESLGTAFKESFTAGQLDNPMFVDAMRVVGELFQEGGYINSMPNNPKQRKSAAATMFPNHK